MNESLGEMLLDAVIEEVGIYLTGEEIQTLVDKILEVFNEWFQQDIYA